MMNNSINFTSKFFSKYQKIKNDNAEEVKQHPQIEEEDNSFEGTAKRVKQEDMKLCKDLVAGSLLAMSLISSPFVYSAITDNESDFRSGVSAHITVTDDDEELLDRANMLSKFGKDSTVLEAHEFKQLLDYSSLEGIPRLARENIRVNATAGFLPINMKSYKSNEEIIKQVKNAQFMIDYVAKKYKENPPKSYIEKQYDYVVNNVTDKEILDKVDFSELEVYQNDLTGVKNSIRMNTPHIKRDDIDADKKEKKAIQDAQKFVDTIVQRYKARSKVSGNYDGNTELSKMELMSLLNFDSVKDLPDVLKIRIINKALEDYQPRSLNHVKEYSQAKAENELVERDKQKVQDKLDEWAVKAHKEFAHLLHPDEITLIKND